MRMFRVPLLDTLLPQTKATYAGAVVRSVNPDLTMTIEADDTQPSVVRRFILCTPTTALLNPPSTRHVGSTARGLQVFELEIPKC